MRCPDWKAPTSAKGNRDPTSNHRGKDRLRFTRTYGQGFGRGRVRSSEAAMNRPFRHLIDKGKPVGRVVHLFTDPEGLPSRVVGSLCVSRGGRLLFFPAFRDRTLNWYTDSQGRTRIGPRRSTVDHLSLGPGLRRWHVTLLDAQGRKRDRIERRRTRPLPSGGVYWFGLSLADPSVLERTPENLVIEMEATMEDVPRRLREFLDAEEGVVSHLLRLPGDHFLREGHFMQFDFIVDFSGSTHDKQPPSYPPDGPPILREKVRRPRQHWIRSHSVLFPDFPGTVEILLSQNEGELVHSVMLLNPEP